MANVLINPDTMTSIANAIRSKTGKTAKIKPAAMPAEITSITTGADATTTQFARDGVILKALYNYVNTQTETQELERSKLVRALFYERIDISELNSVGTPLNHGTELYYDMHVRNAKFLPLKARLNHCGFSTATPSYNGKSWDDNSMGGADMSSASTTYVPATSVYRTRILDVSTNDPDGTPLPFGTLRVRVAWPIAAGPSHQEDCCILDCDAVKLNWSGDIPLPPVM